MSPFSLALSVLAILQLVVGRATGYYIYSGTEESASRQYEAAVCAIPGVQCPSTTREPFYPDHSSGMNYCMLFPRNDDPLLVIGSCLKSEFKDLLLLVIYPTCLFKASFGSMAEVIRRHVDHSMSDMWYNLVPVPMFPYSDALESVKRCLDRNETCHDCVQHTQLSDLIDQGYQANKYAPTTPSTTPTTTTTTRAPWKRNCKSHAGNAVCNVDKGEYCDCCFSELDENNCYSTDLMNHGSFRG
ncbi:uncharacterized protein LOC129591147 [Paramacrobiotus metropolitanus]|uniref:uncharacterized protein LOC129591147 n=1 Tax=Paramacrobiotus metropolitanus TaxID=2943436 RepID=UPI002445DDD8|nr:uncharacterized protein LOC129591147 [Paramacrobiotus metropolitanus]